MSRAPRPKEIWIIFDPLDGPHIFRSQSAAFKTYKKWKKEAQYSAVDSFYEMSEPIRYCFDDPPKGAKE